MPTNAPTIPVPSNATLKKAMKSPDVESFVQERMPVLLGRMWDLAMGAMVLEEKLDEESGEVIPRIYRLPPDRQALAFLIENGIGKVPNRVEMTGKDGGALRVVPWLPATQALQLMDGDTIEGESRDVTDG